MWWGIKLAEYVGSGQTHYAMMSRRLGQEFWIRVNAG
jgi:hypothetical protein